MAEEKKTTLEEAAKEFATQTMPFTDETYVDEGAYHGFIAGAEWQKQRMMKEAVRGTIWVSDHGLRGITMSSDEFQEYTRLLTTGDIVKVIIVKQ